MTKDKESDCLRGKPSRYIRSFFGVLGVGCLAWWFYANYAHHDFFLETRIQKQISFYQDHDGGFNLAQMTSRPIKKVCVQGPYDLREDTEQRFREKLPEFDQIDEDRFIWWFFYEDGGVGWIQVSRRLMDFDDSHPSIYHFVCGESPLRVEVSLEDITPPWKPRRLYRLIGRSEKQ